MRVQCWCSLVPHAPKVVVCSNINLFLRFFLSGNTYFSPHRSRLITILIVPRRARSLSLYATRMHKSCMNHQNHNSRNVASRSVVPARTQREAACCQPSSRWEVVSIRISTSLSCPTMRLLIVFLAMPTLALGSSPVSTTIYYLLEGSVEPSF